MTSQYYIPQKDNAGVPSRAPVSLWCRGYREIGGFTCPYLQYCVCRDVPAAADEDFCKNTKTNETVMADRGTQSAPVAPAGVARRGGAPSARPENGKEV